MVISSNDLLQVVSLLSAEQNLQVTVSQSLKGGAIAGLGALLGGLALGPRGLAIGGASGGLLAAVLAEDSFKSVAHVIRYEMKSDDREQLVALLRGIIHDVDAQDMIALTAVVNATPSLKRHIIAEVTRFFSRRMNVTIQ